ncbi:auxin efflux carrier component 2-like [Trifolium pratense]|uniref:auxin efflux carrier component 2-like n=1 Tax=Trifolium pratense TaxID=57577 RepID=UPI001E695B4B|nr:auxin efflux carrier component 2-like [Trifolium pratense]
MIKGKDVYNILESIMPLYVAMLLGYGSIKWWKMFTPDQCIGINRFVAMFAVPTLTFIYISPINPYHMNWRFIVADILQKIVTLICLFLWNIFTKRDGFDWSITIFSLINLPNTLVVGIPLLNAMYGEFTVSLLIQILVMQSVLWYNVVLLMYEYRAAKLFISQQFVETNEGSQKVENEIESNVDVELGEIGNNGVKLSHSTSKVSNLTRVDAFSSYTNSPQNNDFEEMLDIWKKFQKSRSCTSIGGVKISPYPNLKSNSEKIIGKTKINFSGRFGTPQEIEASKGVNELVDKNSSAKVIELEEHENEEMHEEGNVDNEQQMLPSHDMMTKLILVRVWRKMLKNPNLYAAVLAIVWAFIASRLDIKMPSIIHDSITIISHTGLGMSMFSLGIFMALQPKIIACGKTSVTMSTVLRFLVGPLLFAATSASLGIRGVVFKVGIIQAALPQGIVPFVFAKEYNLHAEIFNAAVSLGLALAFPITILYYVILGA